MNELVVAAVALAMAIGLVGTFVPLLPGLPLVWAAAVAYGVIEGVDAAGWVALAAITLLLVAGTALKVVIPQRRAAAGGATRSSLVVAAVAGIVGFFVIPVIGLPVGAAAGLLAAEYRRTQDWSSAWLSTKRAIVGFGIATLVELAAGIAMVGCWAVWVLLAA